MEILNDVLIFNMHLSINDFVLLKFSSRTPQSESMFLSQHIAGTHPFLHLIMNDIYITLKSDNINSDLELHINFKIQIHTA